MASSPKKTEIIPNPGSRDTRAVRKSNDEIGYRIKSGHMSLLSRKMLNVLVWYAQEMKNQEDEHGRWSLPVAQLIKDARFNSRDYDLLRQALDELQDVRVVRPARGGGITSEVMIPSYTIDNVAHEGNEMLPRGQKRRGGELRLWFMLPPELKSQLLEPNQYTRVPITIMATMRTVSGLALYEICRRYSTNPGGITKRDSWQNWWRVLVGATQDADPPEYKYVKRDVLKRGVDEVNKLTDIDVELVEFKSGKFVRDIQFNVRLKEQRSLDMGPPPLETALLARLTALGITISDAERITVRHPEGDIVATLDLLDRRLKNANQSPIESPAAYFRKALKDGYAASSRNPVALSAPVVSENETPSIPDTTEQQIGALADYDGLTDEEKDIRWQNFLNDTPGAAKAYAGRKRVGLLARKAFGVWLCKNAVRN
jgi:hypothetical protein